MDLIQAYGSDSDEMSDVKITEDISDDDKEKISDYPSDNDNIVSEDIGTFSSSSDNDNEKKELFFECFIFRFICPSAKHEGQIKKENKKREK